MMANPIENIMNIINLLMANRIDVVDLSESQRKEIYYQADEMIIKEMNLLNQILLLPTNENLDIENWLKGSGNYQKGLYLKNLIESFYQKKEEKPQPKQNKKFLKSYVWQVNAEKELPGLYSQMKDEYKLIAPETTYGQFEAVFTGQPIDENFKPIKWHQDNASELLYFILKLQETSNIQNSNRTDYKTMTACFEKPDGLQFKANWKQLKQTIEINLSDEKQRAIDKLVSNFT